MRALRARLQDPVFWTDASQLLKTVGAAVAAWVLARRVFGVPQPFLAPWAALLTVNATVYRSLARGAQQVGATVIGVLLAMATSAVLGVGAGSLALMLFAGMLAGATRGLRAESTTAAATAVVVLLTGPGGTVAFTRLLDTVIGIAVGLLVNLLVWPPLRDRSAARQVDRIDDELGALLEDMAHQLREGGDAVDEEGWVRRTRELDHDVDAAWAVVRQARESGRLNLRRGAAARVRASDEFEALLARLEQAVAETRSMARTIGRSSPWDARFGAAWLELLARAGAAVSGADRARVEQVSRDLDAAAGDLGGEDGGVPLRPQQAALLVNLRNIVDAMDAVAEAQPVRGAAPSPGLRRRFT